MVRVQSSLWGRLARTRAEREEGGCESGTTYRMRGQTEGDQGLESELSGN